MMGFASEDFAKTHGGIVRKEKELGLTSVHTDLVSHFVLRLACCTSDDAAKWFVQHETILFEKRYKRAKEHIRSPIHMLLNIKDDPVDKHRLLTQFPHINGVAPIQKFSNEFDREGEEEILPYHLVKFNEVCDLVSRRQVLLKAGLAWVPHSKFYSVVRGRFRGRLNKSMALLKRAHTFNRMRADESASRLVPILECIPQALDKSYGKSQLVSGNITVQSMGRLKKHMPLCMQLIIEEDCMKKKYARHWGILHLGLFLKGVGLPLIEATKFWRRSLKDEKKFKEVQGTLKHMYGVSGSKKDYTPYGCYKLVDSVADKSPEKNCHYGCPFQYYSDKKLKGVLRGKKIDDKDIDEILKLKKGKHFNIACKKVFQSTHGSVMAKQGLTIDDIENSWEHPNRYFDSSYHVFHPEAKGK
eukprot:UN24904